MISAYLQGGLGNQMFQIAATISLAKENNTTACFCTKMHSLPMQGRKSEMYLDNVFRNINFVDNISPSLVYHEPFFHYLKIPYREGLCLYGYFQSEKYFQNISNLIKKLFSPDENINSIIEAKYRDILIQKPVSVHIRRGDYLTETHFVEIPDRASYYDKVFDTFPSDTKYLIFSDDIEWCERKFVGEHFYFAKDNEDYIDLYLMSKCAHNIITNSTFSWWAAWLNDSANKRVIAPNSWFANGVDINIKDLLPKRWETL